MSDTAQPSPFEPTPAPSRAKHITCFPVSLPRSPCDTSLFPLEEEEPSTPFTNSVGSPSFAKGRFCPMCDKPLKVIPTITAHGSGRKISRPLAFDANTPTDSNSNYFPTTTLEVSPMPRIPSALESVLEFGGCPASPPAGDKESWMRRWLWSHSGKAEKSPANTDHVGQDEELSTSRRRLSNASSRVRTPVEDYCCCAPRSQGVIMTPPEIAVFAARGRSTSSNPEEFLGVLIPLAPPKQRGMSRLAATPPTTQQRPATEEYLFEVEE